jgi:hypothetical protein
VLIDSVELVGCKNAMIKFSNDGNYFSLYQPETQTLRVFDSSKKEDFEKFIDEKV